MDVCGSVWTMVVETRHGKVLSDWTRIVGIRWSYGSKVINDLLSLLTSAR